MVGFCCAGDVQEPASPVALAQGFNSEFAHTLGSTMEEGFFGGVKWGIAAAFYHVFYRIMALAVSGAPYAYHSLKELCTYWSDTYAGRPPVLSIHELHVLVGLLQEALQEYEVLGTPLSDQQTCTTLCRRTLGAVMQHVHDYITIRSIRYTDPYTDQEILFLMALIADTLQGILGCIECAEFHKEIVATAKTTVVLINKLIILLQGPMLDKDSCDPSMAWFSNKKGFYACYV